MIGECFDIFFWRSSESSSGDSPLVALSGNLLLSSPRHRTGVKAPARAADSTNARNTGGSRRHKSDDRALSWESSAVAKPNVATTWATEYPQR